MKSRYFGMAVVAISTFAFVNCGNESSPRPNVIGELYLVPVKKLLFHLFLVIANYR